MGVLCQCCNSSLYSGSSWPDVPTVKDDEQPIVEAFVAIHYKIGDLEMIIENRFLNQKINVLHLILVIAT